MFLFSGSNLSAHATQNLYIHNISGNGRKPVKKIIPNHATLLLTMKPEVESPLNRIYISYNRRGRRAFAVFLLSFFIGMCRSCLLYTSALKKQISLTVSLMQLSATCLSEISKSLIRGTTSTSS